MSPISAHWALHLVPRRALVNASAPGVGSWLSEAVRLKDTETGEVVTLPSRHHIHCWWPRRSTTSNGALLRQSHMSFLPADTNGLVSRSWNGTPISRRTTDGYVNASAMCKANGKRWTDYRESNRCQVYLDALESVTGISVHALVESRSGGAGGGGTWVHPQVAVDLARWISAPFAVWMDGWFLEEFEKRAAGTEGSSPREGNLESWRHFHDRVDMTHSTVPLGYFCVFQESFPMIVPMIRAGVDVSDRVIPDISVGMAWSKHWKDNDLALKHGEPVAYNHNYPDYYPQAASNPQRSHAYPDAALGEFRRWLHAAYTKNKLQKYVLGKLWATRS